MVEKGRVESTHYEPEWFVLQSTTTNSCILIECTHVHVGQRKVEWPYHSCFCHLPIFLVSVAEQQQGFTYCSVSYSKYI